MITKSFTLYRRPAITPRITRKCHDLEGFQTYIRAAYIKALAQSCKHRQSCWGTCTSLRIDQEKVGKICTLSRCRHTGTWKHCSRHYKHTGPIQAHVFGLVIYNLFGCSSPVETEIRQPEILVKAMHGRARWTLESFSEYTPLYDLR